jgi:hypothetical protein
MIRGTPVISRDDFLCERRDAPDRDIVEIERRLLICHEARIEATRAFVARIRRDDGKSARQRGRIAGGLSAKRICDVTVQSTAALKQEAAVPIVWKSDGEPDAVGFPVGACTGIDHPVNAATRWKIV